MLAGDVGDIEQQHRLAIIEQGDEVLDWREMSAHYSGATQMVLPGNDHALSDFAQRVDTVLDFLGLQA